MITIEEALSIVMDNTRRLDPCFLDITEAYGRVIAEDIYATEDVPPFNNSAMDGFAIRFADTLGASTVCPVTLEILEDLPAGKATLTEVGKGQSIRIMTGACMPKSADAVVMLEDVEEKEGSILVNGPISEKENVREAGEDIRQGELVIPRDTVLGPAEIGLLASLGFSRIKTFAAPVVAIISTGNELVEVGDTLTPGKIRNSNSYSLNALVLKYGGIPYRLGIAADQEEVIRGKMEEALRADLILTSGGVSVGDYDYVKMVAEKMGAESYFWGVAMKPGKPLTFATIKGKPFFGLPGNPVAVMVSFEQFVRPAMLKMMGKQVLPLPEVEAELQEEIRKKPGRTHFIRGLLIKGESGKYMVSTTGPQGSNILKSMVLANCLIVVSKEKTFLNKGESVKVQLLKEQSL